MKFDPMCAACASDCKQPAAAKLVSCPQFKRATRNLDMFDMNGNISKNIAGKARPGGKKSGPND